MGALVTLVNGKPRDSFSHYPPVSTVSAVQSGPHCSVGQLTRNQATVKTILQLIENDWKIPLSSSHLPLFVEQWNIYGLWGGGKESSGYDIEFFLTNTTTKKSLKIIPGEKSTHFFF